MRKDREIGRLDMISARIRPDETLFLEEMSEAFKISKGEVIRAALMIARRLLQDEETGKINKEIWDRFNDTPPYDFLEAGSVETTPQSTSHAQ